MLGPSPEVPGAASGVRGGRVRASQPPVGTGKVHGERGARPPAQSTGAWAGGPGVTACPLGPPGALCTALSSPQMTRSLALLQKALRFPKSASPCRALLPSKVRKVKVPGPGRPAGFWAGRAHGCLSSIRAVLIRVDGLGRGICLSPGSPGTRLPLSRSFPDAGGSVIRAARALFSGPFLCRGGGELF